MTTQPVRQRLDPEDRRRQLIELGIELCAQRGAEVGFDEVARAAGVQRSLLYRYFSGGWPDLYHAVVSECWRQLLARIDSDPSRPLVAKLPRNVALFLDLAETEDPALLVVWQSHRAGDPRVDELGRAARRELAAVVARNHLGNVEAPEATIAAIRGYLAMGELLLEEWRVHGTITRADVERMLRGVLPELVRIASET